ncbi:MAG: hypothetical protein ACEY3F_04940 [Wolbachia sp.]
MLSTRSGERFHQLDFSLFHIKLPGLRLDVRYKFRFLKDDQEFIGDQKFPLRKEIRNLSQRLSNLLLFFTWYNYAIKYVDGLAVMTTTEKKLQQMMDRISKVGEKYEMRLNSDKSKVMKVST